MKYHFSEEDMIYEGQNWNNHSSKTILQYALGALLYTPATSARIGEDICSGRYPEIKAWALCLEDAIHDQSVAQAEEQLVVTLQEVASAVREDRLGIDQVPLLFVRVRNPEQMLAIFERIKDFSVVLTGFIAPKFEPSNMTAFGQALQEINGHDLPHPLYLMPTLESKCVIDLATRSQTLQAIKASLDQIAPWILNIRVGGNDFCNQFGVRRGKQEPIYDIGLINQVLVDILNVFSRDYVVSAPVWEYFGVQEDYSWQVGLQEELRLEKINGFVGKTAIHPSQLKTIQRAYVVDERDYLDALQVLNWDDQVLGVQKGALEKRMNEAKVHSAWAAKVMALSEVYGVKRG